jgi:hypothetical protein
VEPRKRLRGFKWSSYRRYAGLSTPFRFVDESIVLGELRVEGKQGSNLEGVLPKSEVLKIK